MMISTRGRYALRLMLDLANHQGSGYVSLKEISERQQISKKYLEQIIPLFTDIFPGLTEEELDTCEIADMVTVVQDVFVYMSEEIGKLGSGKN